MISKTHKPVVLSVVLSMFAALFFLNVPATCFGFEIAIDVSPNVLNLESQGQVVTVHTDVPYPAVDVSSVYLNGVLINSWKADDRGYFVAKFVMAAIKDLPLEIDAYNTLQLVGLTLDGEAFGGEQDIKVIQNIPQGR